MESPKRGILLLALVAVTTASGAFLGWTMRPQAVPVDMHKPASDMPVGVTGASIDAPTPAGTLTEKQPSSSQ